LLQFEASAVSQRRGVCDDTVDPSALPGMFFHDAYLADLIGWSNNNLHPPLILEYCIGVFRSINYYYDQLTHFSTFFSGGKELLPSS
jgi:hypothetical protein